MRRRRSGRSRRAVCGGETLARGGASRVADGRTFVLDDGREVRLAAIEVPPLSQGSGEAPGGAAAKDGLAALLAGAEIVLRAAEPQKTDRYGRIVAYAFVTRTGIEEVAATGWCRRNCLAQASPAFRPAPAAAPAPWNS